MLGRLAGHAEGADDSAAFAVDGVDRPGAGVEDDDADGGGIDQCFEAVSGELLFAIAAGVGDDEGGLGGESGERFLVFLVEFGFAGTAAEEDVADAFAAVADGVCHECCDGDGLEFGQAECCDVGVEVGDSQGGGGGC